MVRYQQLAHIGTTFALDKPIEYFKVVFLIFRVSIVAYKGFGAKFARFFSFNKCT